MELLGGAYAGWYLANSLYVWSAKGKGVLEQAPMWIMLIMTPAIMTLATSPACAIAAILEKLGEIMLGLNDYAKTKIINRIKDLRSVRGDLRALPQL